MIGASSEALIRSCLVSAATRRCLPPVAARGSGPPVADRPRGSRRRLGVVWPAVGGGAAVFATSCGYVVDMNRLKSSSVTIAGSIITPLIACRTSSNATRLLGLVMASVSRLLANAIGTTRWALISGLGQQRHDARIDLNLGKVDEIDAGRAVRLDQAFGEHAQHRDSQLGMGSRAPARSPRCSSTAHVVSSSASTEAVRGWPVSIAISPNICPAPSSARTKSTPVSGSRRRTATRPDRMKYAAPSLLPSRTMSDCGTKSRRRMRRSRCTRLRPGWR